MNKKLIRLTESDLHRIVKETANRVLNEISDATKQSYINGRRQQGRGNRPLSNTMIKKGEKTWQNTKQWDILVVVLRMEKILQECMQMQRQQKRIWTVEVNTLGEHN